MTKIIHELPVVFTCFAYRPEYVAEMDGMLPTISKHHPGWPIVAGRGPIDGYELPTLEVESPAGKQHWSLPVPLNLEGTVDDWRKITRVKAWWIGEVWHKFGGLAGPWRRALWIDAEARLLGPLDIELEPEAEVIAGSYVDPHDDEDDEDMIESGFLFFQGAKGGRVEGIIDEWSSLCVSQIENMPPPNPHWPDSDQDVLKRVLRDLTDTEGYTLLKLEQDKYNAMPDDNGTLIPGALVAAWTTGGRSVV
ncbi:MAG TPA: hypothetical protein VN345_18330 [Blastocatellia bacterium]|nr:hypothetical protein [Blastocatellia bacterium]